MATKSILKNIDIKDKDTADAFISALENASGKKTKQTKHTRMYSDASRDEIKKMFGERNDGIQNRKSN